MGKTIDYNVLPYNAIADGTTNNLLALEGQKILALSKGLELKTSLGHNFDPTQN